MCWFNQRQAFWWSGMFEIMIKVKAYYDVTFSLEDLKALNNVDFHDCWCSHFNNWAKWNSEKHPPNEEEVLKNYQQWWVEYLSLTSKTHSVQLSNNYCKVTDTKAHAFPKAFWDHSLSPKTLGNAVDICWDKEGESGLGQGFRL